MDNETEQRDFAVAGDSTYSLDYFSSHQRVAPKNNLITQKGHQKLVFTDPAAFRYLEEDPSTTVLERRRRLTGYELYVVEQWACSRVHPTFVITTYTGLEQNSVVVSVLSVPTNEEAWSPRLRVYLKAITKYHARKKETPLGALMVTNLNSFPSALTVIAVPDGDLRKHREDFIVNEDLKRLGCSGRAGLNLTPPIGATAAKFNQLYHISDRIPIYNAVIELLKLCQVALMLFGKLAPEYADGLLCDVTEQAINDWWTDIGSDYFNVDPSDGILGPTTVAALLGTLMGARNRLNAYGSPVSKDVFDIVNTKRGIAYFQKSQKLERTRRLDRKTLDQLHKVTAKAISKEGWAVRRAVKSTVAELSGKGGDIVSGREKAGIAEVETLDMETFVQLGVGERFKWLWWGKPRKNNDREDVFSNLGGEDGMVFNDNQDGGYSWSGKKRDSVDDDTSLRHTLSDRIYLQSPGSQSSLNHSEKDQALRSAVLKNMTGKVTDARSGLGRIRDAVGRRGHRTHHSKHSQIDNVASDSDSLRARTSIEQPRGSDPAIEPPQQGSTDPDSGEQSPTGSVQSSRRGSTHHESLAPPFYPNKLHLKDFNKSSTSIDTPATSININDPDAPDYMTMLKSASSIRPRLEGRETAENPRSEPLTLKETRALRKMQEFDTENLHISPLRHTRSLSRLPTKGPHKYWDSRWPRHLSYTAMVDVLAASSPYEIHATDSLAARGNASTALAVEKSLALEAQVMSSRLEDVRSRIQTWTEEEVSQVEVYDTRLNKDGANLDFVYHQKMDEYTNLRDASEDLVSEERGSLGERVRDLDTLGAKLEYELSALEGKVEDVENGVREFERQVQLVEIMAQELDNEDLGEGSWTGWVLGKLWMLS